jgi:hypothetical protein
MMPERAWILLPSGKQLDLLTRTGAGCARGAPSLPLPCLHDTAGGRSLGEQTTTVQEFIENLECDFLEDSHSGWEDGESTW